MSKEKIQKAIDSLALSEDANDSNSEMFEESISSILKERTANYAKLQKIIKETFSGSDFEFRGDDVYFNNKKIGEIEADLSDMDSGIIFKSADGKFTQEFGDIESVYKFLDAKFNKTNESFENVEGDTINESDEVESLADDLSAAQFSVLKRLDSGKIKSFDDASAKTKEHMQVLSDMGILDSGFGMTDKGEEVFKILTNKGGSKEKREKLAK